MKVDTPTNYSSCNFDECKNCEFGDYNCNTMICLISRLGLAIHNLLLELPFTRECVEDHKFCNWFIEKE